MTKLTKLEHRLSSQVSAQNIAMHQQAVAIEELQIALADRETKVAELQSLLLKGPATDLTLPPSAKALECDA